MRADRVSGSGDIHAMTRYLLMLGTLVLAGVAFAGCEANSSHPAMSPNTELTISFARTEIFRDPRLGEITDLLPSQTPDGTNILVLGSKGVVSLQTRADGKGYDLIQFARIERPVGARGFGNHFFGDIDGDNIPEIIQGGDPDNAVKLAVYSLDGTLRWVVDPDLPLKTGWANTIKHVQLVKNTTTGERRLIVLSFMNEECTVISNDGRVVAQPKAGRLTSSRAAVAWQGTGSHWTGCIFGSGSNLIGIDGDGAVLFSTPLPEDEKYVSEVRQLRSDGTAEEFLVLGIRGPNNEYINSVVMPEHLAGNGWAIRSRVVMEDEAWVRTALVPLRFLQDGTEYWVQHAIIESQTAPAGVAGRLLCVSIWTQDGKKAGSEEFVATKGGGRFGQTLGNGAIAPFSLKSPNDAMLVGWGDTVWLVQIQEAP